MGKNFKKKYILQVIVLTALVLMSSWIAVGDTPPLRSMEPPDNEWSSGWKYKEEIVTHLRTDNTLTHNQPIDMQMFFEDQCWAINESVHSIRICCWHQNTWYELESQIYDLEFIQETLLYSCGVIFLIPDFADGTERYYLYYDDSEKAAPAYTDHVSVRDTYYYVEPITGISVEGDYYEIIEDNKIIYGIGQKGQVMDRKLSQIAIKMKPDSKEFDILNTDLIASYSFSFQDGPKDSNEISSDQVLLSKEITVDGNLMVEFHIVSQSSNGALKSSNSYRYYYNPTENKRLYTHVDHEVLKNSTVRDIKNADGKYVGFIAYHSSSPTVKKMIFGEILPYLHTYNEYDRIDEYQLDEDPKSSSREWIISVEDDCDLGSNAWVAYGQGIGGKTHGLLFSSHTNLITNGSNERDGLQVKVSEREYLDVVGAEVDYASISIGRNSFEPSENHDVFIEKGLRVEADIEFVTFQNGSYDDINEESKIFQTLMKYRHDIDKNQSKSELTYTLTVIPHLSGRILSYPFLRNITGINAPILTAALYENETCIAVTSAINPIIGFQRLKFPKIPPGKYTVRIYREYGNNTKRYIGFGAIRFTNDTSLHIYCTWEKKIRFTIHDQFQNAISNLTIQVMHNKNLVTELETNKYTNVTLSVPFYLFNSYEISKLQNISLRQLFKKADPFTVLGFYKGFEIYNASWPLHKRLGTINLSLYDIMLNITDELGLKPAVNTRPILISSEMILPQEITPDQSASYGWHLFRKLPAAVYSIQIAYGGYRKEKDITIPSCGDMVDIRFALLYQLQSQLMTIRAEPIDLDHVSYSIKRNGKRIHESLSDMDSLFLPPGEYTVNVYDKTTLIGSTTVDLTTDKNIHILTSTPSMLYLVITIVGFLGVGLIILLRLLHIVSLNTCLKIVTLSLVIMALVQPWWTLTAESEDGTITKSNNMYLSPQVMIEEYVYNDQVFLNLETIPSMFTEFVHMLLLIIWVGISFMLISFIPNMILKRRFSLLLAAASIVFVVAVAFAFSVGMTRITEISLGSLQGTGVIPMHIPSGETLYMQASWGLGLGFYLVLFASGISIAAGIIDFLRKNRRILSLFHKKSK